MTQSTKIVLAGTSLDLSSDAVVRDSAEIARRSLCLTASTAEG